MDFDDTPDEAAFRRSVRQWLAQHAEPRVGGGQSFIELFEHSDPADEEKWVEACRQWQRTKDEKSFGSITIPAQWGGHGGTPIQEAIFDQEESGFDVATGAFGITLGMVAPTILAYGDDSQRGYIRAMLAGDEIWCQLFSEPEAGSDLAGLRTRADRDGDHWVVNGQKVWTSGAHYADWGYLIARTDPTVPKHLGLTAFLLPMDSPGVTVRPLRQMTGGANFNEVFFDEVRIPDVDRLGEPGQGWAIALTTLASERSVASGFRGGPLVREALHSLARERERTADPVVRQRLADVYIAVEIGRFSSYRVLTALSQGRPLGPEIAATKLALTQTMQRMADLATELAGPAATLDTEWSQLVLGVPGLRIAGGTDEIIRNVLGERVLRLPAEPRQDKTMAFSDLRP